MERAWYIGNTTIRNAKRLKDGLTILVRSSLHGNLVGKKAEQEFARLLHESGVVYLKRLDESKNSDVSDVGRKWRAALMQLGFITPSPSIVKNSKLKVYPYCVTSNGRRLIKVDSLPEEQECFLRALLAYQIPSEIENHNGAVFSPLRIVLEILEELKKQGLDSSISKDEMASFVQVTRDIESVKKVVNNISQFRSEANKSVNRKQYVRKVRESVADCLSSQSSQTLLDYADSNFRYLKLTGLFAEDGRKIRIAKHKTTIVKQIAYMPFEPISSTNYLNTLWNGANLPTDNTPEAIEAIETILSHIKENGEHIDVPDLYSMEVEDLSQLRLKLEGELFKILEYKFAENQIYEWKDILAYLRALTVPIRRGSIVPQGEGPAYLEWALWRAFLAINSLENKPWEARRFKVDQEFLPVGTAPGNGPDIIFEFEDFVIVGEVTLTSSSRQEAVEGEPVRRHVADLVDQYENIGKRVYGLFMANNIDTNTAETFRIGVWYRNDDSRMALQIVPMTLNQFADLFEAGFSKTNRLLSSQVEQTLRDCLVESNNDAPEWKRRIDMQIKRSIQHI
ncbi:AlwI restriction endonuclease [Pelagirhabdus alkalitolerans]|uniref:AlwI restriction endonuclease n=1 Tax=Pelagirhabdus alkalitolerans TaxID=1612202 RepID=A0A1G6GRE4_9BACI|nr:AlwI family type II restriction endonuclease [Pelagirhabdus alkalitolerans]SDB84612.1 AlwI restriction endonuclease [Pelagirhabdus alkalitolerans]